MEGTDPRMIALARVVLDLLPNWLGGDSIGCVYFVDRKRANSVGRGASPIFARIVSPESLAGREDQFRSLTPEQQVRVMLAWVEDAHAPGMTANITHQMWLAAREQRGVPHE